jgi:ribose-phosphate pyrophosphokinase
MERMKIIFFSGRAHPALAKCVAAELGVELSACILENFPDDEFRVELLGSVERRDVYILQPTSPPSADCFLELVLMADAAKRAGAARVTALVPYFGYARQDRRTAGREPVGARVVAEMMETRIDRVVTVDLHTPAIEGFFRIPVEHLSAVPLLAEALQAETSPSSVLVAPDLGAAKLARHYSKFLDLPLVYVHKSRLSAREVGVREVVGEVRDRSPILVDDMITTGGTLISAMKALLDRGCAPYFTIAATHGVLVGDALRRLAAFPLSKLMLTDSIPTPDSNDLPMHVVSLKKILAEAIRKLSGNLTVRTFC